MFNLYRCCALNIEQYHRTSYQAILNSPSFILADGHRRKQHQYRISVGESGAIEGSSETLIDRRKMYLHYFDLLNVTLRTLNWKILQTDPIYIVHRYNQINFVNETFHKKALTGTVVYLSYSCALILFNTCAFPLNIRQTLATFLVIQFPPQLIHLVKIW